jgi:hypothetical protein
MARMKEDVRLKLEEVLEALDKQIKRSMRGEMNRRELIEAVAAIESDELSWKSFVRKDLKERRERLIRLANLELSKSIQL